jgi:micrococcal nuclease
MPTWTPLPSPTPTYATITYLVQPGDTLTHIAAKYGTTAEVICALNALSNCSLITPGQELVISGEALVPTTPAPSATSTHKPTPTYVPTPTSPSPTATLAGEPAEVVGIVDGDTIDIQIGGQIFRVRYIGMNTPETGQPCASEATNYNTMLVMGKVVTLVKDVSQTDRYGRLLRYVYVGDIFVNAELARQGYANAATYPPDVAYADLLVQLEAEARAAGRGCWAISRTPTTGTGWNCSGNIYNCSDFASCAEVMSYWYACPGDPSRLDGDNDGKPCESLCGY